MKTFLTLALLAISASVSAFEQTATLDFSNLYGKTDAGVYEMKVTFTPKTTNSESTLSFNTHQDDGWFTCTTTASFEIGEMNFSLVNVKNGWTKNITRKISAGVSNQVDGTECDTSIEKLAGKQVVYSLIGLQEPIVLDVKAPFEYKSVGVYLAPFNGYLNLESDLTVVGNKLVLNPSELLTARSILPMNANNSSVTYYVYAVDGATTLSLGTGLIKFNK